MNQVFLSAFVAGLAYGAVPGVINVEAIRRALTHGFGAAVRFQVGALAGDALWATAALCGVIIIRPCTMLHAILGVGGALLLGSLGFIALRDSLRGHTPAALQPSRHNHFAIGALLSLGNPFAVVFWLSIGGSLLPAGALAPQLPMAVTAVGAFILATLIWSVLLATIASYGRTLVTSYAFRWLNAAASICIAFCGVGLLWRTLAAL
jgi:threonine/homoserine/homoserine lactone efflux protein